MEYCASTSSRTPLRRLLQLHAADEVGEIGDAVFAAPYASGR
jgi:hypothetical protein